MRLQRGDVQKENLIIYEEIKKSLENENNSSIPSWMKNSFLYQYCCDNKISNVFSAITISCELFVGAVYNFYFNELSVSKVTVEEYNELLNKTRKVAIQALNEIEKSIHLFEICCVRRALNSAWPWAPQFIIDYYFPIGNFKLDFDKVKEHDPITLEYGICVSLMQQIRDQNAINAESLDRIMSYNATHHAFAHWDAIGTDYTIINPQIRPKSAAIIKQLSRETFNTIHCTVLDEIRKLYHKYSTSKVSKQGLEDLMKRHEVIGLNSRWLNK